MKTLIESIFDDEQSYVDKSGEINICNIRTKDDYRRWLETNDLLYSKSTIKKAFQDYIGYDISTIKEPNISIEDQNTYNDDNTKIMYLLTCKHGSSNSYMNIMRLFVYRWPNETAMCFQLNNGFVTTNYGSKFVKKLKKILGNGWIQRGGLSVEFRKSI